MGRAGSAEEVARLKKDKAIYDGMISFLDQEVGRLLDKLDEIGLRDSTLMMFTTRPTSRSSAAIRAGAVSIVEAATVCSVKAPGSSF